jgi:hypothetical protein
MLRDELYKNFDARNIRKMTLALTTELEVWDYAQLADGEDMEDGARQAMLVVGLDNSAKIQDQFSPERRNGSLRLFRSHFRKWRSLRASREFIKKRHDDSRMT